MLYWHVFDKISTEFRGIFVFLWISRDFVDLPEFHGPHQISEALNNLQPGCTFDVILTSLVQFDKILAKFGQQ